MVGAGCTVCSTFLVFYTERKIAVFNVSDQQLTPMHQLTMWPKMIHDCTMSEFTNVHWHLT